MKVLLGIINCQECGKEVSTKAESCPHCGMRQIILNKDLTVRIIYARSSVRSRDGPPFKSMGYEIILIAHFVYVLAMYSTSVKEFQLYLFI